MYVTHYGYRPLRAACGALILSSMAATSDTARVTCARCRGTLKYRMEWFKDNGGGEQS